MRVIENAREGPEAVPEINPARPRSEWRNGLPTAQHRIYQVHYAGGGMIYFPGNYYFTGMLHVPANVTVQGTNWHLPARPWQPEGPSGVPLVGEGGTTFYVDPADAAESVLLDWGSTLAGVTFVQPDQSKERPVAKPPVIRMTGRALVRNVTLFGVWDGIFLDSPGDVSGVYGQCINKGVRLDQGHAGHLVEKVELNQCWAGRGGAVDYQWANGVFFHAVYCDGATFKDCGCRGSGVAWLFEPRELGGQRMLVYVQVNNCGVEVERATGRAVVCRGQSSYHKADFNHCTLAVENLAVDIEPGSNASVQLFKCDHYGTGRLARVGGGSFRSHYGVVGMSGAPMVEVLAGGRAEVKDCVFTDDVAVKMTYVEDGSLALAGNVAKSGITMDKVFPDGPLPVPN